jgi:serine/threonine-protein kinase
LNLPRALALFEAALDQPEADRRSWLTAATTDDPALRAEVEGLLAAHARSGGFLEPVVPEAVPARLGAWRIDRLLGRGGMGEVWRADRADGAFEQQVAIKLLGGVALDPEARRRAEAERAFLAALEHPNIVRVVDGGSLADGRPWVAMEYVEGERIDRWCAARGLDPRERVRLFLQVVDAVDAAHRALIVHRDLKPANVLVTAAGVVKLLDFGIAKSLDGLAPQAHTAAGLGPMTPEYAAPEQLQGRPPTIAVDVWALGVLLHELLTGQLPFPVQGLGFAEVLQRLQAAPASRASGRVDAQRLALARGAIGAWRRQLRGDLDRVLATALEVDPARRYASAREFADDLRHWLAHRPVRARSGGAAYRAAKFVRRHRLPVLVAGAALVAVLAGAGVALQQARIARAEAERARAASAFLGDVLGWADPIVSGREPTLREALDRAAERIASRFAGQPELEADVRMVIGQGYVSLYATDAAQRELDRVLALRTAPSVARARALVALASVDWTRGRTDTAERRYREALAIPALDEDAVAKAEAWNDYAAMLNEVGRYEEAFAAATSAQRATTPAQAPRVYATILSNRAYAEDGLGRAAESLATYAEGAAMLERDLPAAAVDLSINLNNQAMVLRALGPVARQRPVRHAVREPRDVPPRDR